MAGLLLIASIAGSGIVLAAPERDPEFPPSEEIIVTGERVPQALKDTESSVTVLTQEVIEAQAGTDRVDQLLSMVPNVQLGSGTEGPAIRGQDSTGVVRELFAFLGGTRPRATLTVDGRAATYNEYVFGAGSIWDVQQVEIFRSPQTTTQGQNSIAGGIFVVTRDPTYEWEGRARASIGNLASRQASLVLSGPLIDDQLAIRVSGDLKLGRTASEMADGIDEVDIERDDHRLLRIKLLAEPRALPGLRVETSYVHSRSQAAQFDAVRAPFEERRSPLFERTNGVLRTRVDSITSLITYRLSPALTSRSTFSYGHALTRRFGLPGLGRTRIDSDDLSLETILDWLPHDRIKLVGGLHYLTLEQDQFIDITGLGVGIGGFDDRQSSLGLFGEAAWRPVPRLSLTFGLRYQRNTQDRSGQVGPLGPGITMAYDQEVQAWLPKFSVAWDLDQDATIGLLVQRAFNPGGTTVNLFTRQQDDFDSERLWNYEAFFRAGFGGGRGRIAANLFYNAMSDAQRSLLIEFPTPDGGTFTATQIANAPFAESFGLEVDLGWRVSNRLSAQFGLGLLETEIRRTLIFNDPIRNKAFQRAPHFSAMAALDWRPISKLRLSAQLRTRSSYYSDDANTPSRRIGPSTIVNGRAAYAVGPAQLFGYVRNLFDAFDLTYLFNPSFGTAEKPREYGVGMELRF